jgi:predicted deacylase
VLSKNSPITICETTVAAGERASISLPIADLYTGTSLSMPVKVINGNRSGPVLFVCAAIHGDELNGVEIIRRLLKLKSLRSLKGTLLAVPVVNIHGFLDQSRYLPDRRDLNRSFPGSHLTAVSICIRRQSTGQTCRKYAAISPTRRH